MQMHEHRHLTPAAEPSTRPDGVVQCPATGRTRPAQQVGWTDAKARSNAAGLRQIIAMWNCRQWRPLETASWAKYFAIDQARGLSASGRGVHHASRDVAGIRGGCRRRGILAASGRPLWCHGLSHPAGPSAPAPDREAGVAPRQAIVVYPKGPPASIPPSQRSSGGSPSWITTPMPPSRPCRTGSC